MRALSRPHSSLLKSVLVREKGEATMDLAKNRVTPERRRKEAKKQRRREAKRAGTKRGREGVRDRWRYVELLGQE